VSTVEETAKRIADRGRDALVERLRPAFKEAAAAQADVLDLDDEQLDELVQHAADNADGLQWRRALAAVATEELGIGLGEALTHPAVERAQAIVGAPSYEDALAKLGALGDDGQAPPPLPEPVEEPPVREPPREPPVREAPVREAPVIEEVETIGHEVPGEVRFEAVHLGGIANLAPSASDIQLLFTDDGLDILRGPDKSLGRLPWDEIRSLEVPEVRGRRRRTRQQETQLVVRTEEGEATFRIPSLSPPELRDQIDPLMQHIEPSA
jgi:hypothetical protein